MSDVVLEGELTWSGEHWIDYLREPGADTDSGMVSLFVIRWCPAGEGIVAWVQVPGQDLHAIFTDNREVADYVMGSMGSAWSHPPYGADLPVNDAAFERGGDVRHEPSWHIDAGDRQIVATWRRLQPVVMAVGTWKEGPSGNHTHTLLFFAEAADITVDGQAVAGQPYERDIWRESIGGDRSSCVFALAETFARVP
jgi:hypothetical protein